MEAFQNEYARYTNSVENINIRAAESPGAFVLETEETYHAYLTAITEQIDPETCRVIMLSGPSSSGKTTTAHLLMDALAARGINSAAISLDSFYLGEHNAPLLPNGQHDYESVRALDVPAINDCLRGLIESHACNVPIFDFSRHAPTGETRRVSLGENGVAVVEGIHALNPEITEGLPKGVKRIYLSVKQGFSADGKELISPNEVRLLRRLVRDSKFRASSPERTLSMWGTVMEGEYKYIKPFRFTANYTINSLHSYEPCVLHKEAAALLRGVGLQSPFYEEAQKLLNLVDRVKEIDPALIPKNSIIREFLGGSIYADA